MHDVMMSDVKISSIQIASGKQNAVRSTIPHELGRSAALKNAFYLENATMNLMTMKRKADARKPEAHATQCNVANVCSYYQQQKVWQIIS